MDVLYFYPADCTGGVQAKIQDTNVYATIAGRESSIMMLDNSAYMCGGVGSSAGNRREILTDFNVAYYSSHSVKSDHHDYV